MIISRHLEDARIAFCKKGKVFAADVAYLVDVLLKGIGR